MDRRRQNTVTRAIWQKVSSLWLSVAFSKQIRFKLSFERHWIGCGSILYLFFSDIHCMLNFCRQHGEHAVLYSWGLEHSVVLVLFYCYISFSLWHIRGSWTAIVCISDSIGELQLFRMHKLVKSKYALQCNLSIVFLTSFIQHYVPSRSTCPSYSWRPFIQHCVASRSLRSSDNRSLCSFIVLVVCSTCLFSKGVSC